MASQDAWSGWIAFAGIVIIIVGVMDVLQGFVAILEDQYVVATREGLAILDVTAWGWATLIWGALLILAALGLLGGAGGARWLAIIGVAVNAVQQIAFLANYPQAYPLWNLLIVALNIVVLYALTARWQGFKESVAKAGLRTGSRGRLFRPSIRVWSKGLLMFRDEVVPADRLVGERSARSGEVKRLGDEPVVIEFDGARIEVAARAE
jgi:hypothetical protein